ncbi:MAG: N-acetyltransferase family protein [Cyanobacteria bacterium P01_D01_bin.105]
MVIKIRAFDNADIEALTKIYNWYVLKTTITFDLEPYTVEQRQVRWMCHYAAAGRHRLIVAELDGQVIGYASSSQLRIKPAYDPSVEVSIYLSHRFQRLGIGSLLYEKLFEQLRTEDVHRVYAGITVPNEASLAFHQKFDFVEVGRFHEVGRKFGQYWDVVWLERKMP